jgi:hypothetical protein
VTYSGSISREGVVSRTFLQQGDSIVRSVERSLSNITGSELRLRPADGETAPAQAAAAWMRSLQGPGLVPRANDKAADVAKDRGADGQNIREMGHKIEMSTSVDLLLQLMNKHGVLTLVTEWGS